MQDTIGKFVQLASITAENQTEHFQDLSKMMYINSLPCRE